MAKLSILPLLGMLALVWGLEATCAAPPAPDWGNSANLRGGTGHDDKALPSAKDILQDAIRTLEGQSSVSAKISQKINLFGEDLRGSGVYLEQQFGSVRLLRLHLKIQLADERSFLLQVCDGRYLWTHKKFFDHRELSRVDITRAAKALETARQMPSKGNVGILRDLGGLCKMLRQIRDNFHFTSVQSGVLELQSGQLPIWQLRGQWKPDRLAKVLPEQKELIESGKPVDPSKLPDHLPDHVLLTLGQNDRFPYRIEYRRTDGKGGARSLVTIRLYDVTTNVPIDPNRFQFNPGETEFRDGTNAYLQSLGVK